MRAESWSPLLLGQAVAKKLVFSVRASSPVEKEILFPSGGCGFVQNFSHITRLQREIQKVNGYYKRPLPSPPAVDFDSSDGKQLFLEAIQNGTMEGFWKLISHFNTQDDPSFCGPATLAMVLNALAIDPCRKWKGQWRWFDESMLACCEELQIVKTEGITFGKFVCIAQGAGAKVEAFRSSSTSIDEFRKNVIECSTSRNCHVISSYHRAALKQSGSGHFSPIGGYHRGKDMALVLDVARFKYPPHWVPLEALWEGMSYVDDTTGQTRGFMVISRPHRELGMLYSLSCNRKYWSEITKFLTVDVPMLLKSEVMKDIDEVLLSLAATLPSCFEDFIKWFSEIRRQEEGGRVSKDEKARLALKE